MSTTRRVFLRLATGVAALLLGGRAGSEATPTRTALAVHRATRNTRLGAVGTVLRGMRGRLGTEKPYPGRPQRKLPMPELERGRPLRQVVTGYARHGFSAEPIGLETLSRLLLLCNGATGRRRNRILRAAPSAGALYAGEVYLVAERVEGLAPGVYSYGVRRHELAQLSQGQSLQAVADSLAEPLRARNAAAAIVLSNVFDRYRVRYANRSYRYALIDSGHIGENLRLAAAELGLADDAPLRWEDAALNTLLGLDGRGEAVCAVHLVGGRGAKSSEVAAAPARRLVERQLADADFRSDAGWVPGAFHAATELVEVPGSADPVGAATGGADAGSSQRQGANAAPDGAAPPTTTVSAAIRVRRSTRRYATTPLASSVLLDLLALSRRNSALWYTPWLELQVVVHRVEGLDPASTSMRRPAEPSSRASGAPSPSP